MKPFLLIMLAGLVILPACHPKKITGKTMVNQTNMPDFDRQGHRGCRGLMPENTIPAMLRAIDLQVTTLELDVVISKDKQVVVSHDPIFNHEISSHPNGQPVTQEEEKKLLLYQMNYEEIARYDVGMRPHPRFPKQEKIKVAKPRLADLFDEVEKYISASQLRPVFYNIETKCKAATDGINHPEPNEFVELLMAVIKEKGLEKRVIIQSFDMRTLRVLHARYPGIRTALLIDAGDELSLEQNLEKLTFTPSIYSPHASKVNALLVEECKAKGMQLIPWTVNTLDEITQLKKLGVDGIISDYPDLFLLMKK